MPRSSCRALPVVLEHVIEVCDTAKEPSLCTPGLLCNVCQSAVSGGEWENHFQSALLARSKAVVQIPQFLPKAQLGRLLLTGFRE